MNKTIYHGSYLEIEFPPIKKDKFTKNFLGAFIVLILKKKLKSVL